jgi:hypothetical protein
MQSNMTEQPEDPKAMATDRKGGVEWFPESEDDPGTIRWNRRWWAAMFVISLGASFFFPPTLLVTALAGGVYYSWTYKTRPRRSDPEK